jgi:hypothetical protein
MVCRTAHTPRCRGSKANRWDAAPLLDVAGGTTGVAAQVLGVSGDAMTEAVEHGLSDQQADHWAVRLGLHPSMLWPGFDRAALTPLDESFVWDGGWRQAWEWRSAPRLRLIRGGR